MLPILAGPADVNVLTPTPAARDSACILCRTAAPLPCLEPPMTLHLELAPLLSLAAGIAILIVPRLLNYIVAGYLILVGVIGLFDITFS